MHDFIKNQFGPQSVANYRFVSSLSHIFDLPIYAWLFCHYSTFAFHKPLWVFVSVSLQVILQLGFVSSRFASIPIHLLMGPTDWKSEGNGLQSSRGRGWKKSSFTPATYLDQKRRRTIFQTGRPKSMLSLSGVTHYFVFLLTRRCIWTFGPRGCGLKGILFFHMMKENGENIITSFSGIFQAYFFT